MTTDHVERLVVRHCRLPVRSVRAQGSGAVGGDAGIEVVLLEITTAAGVAGWGEAAPWAVFTGTPEAAAAALHRYLAPMVVGRDPADLPAIMRNADALLTGHPEAKAALETALLDVRGQALGVPVWALLGGRCRRTIPLSVSLADPEFARDRDLLDEITTAGVRMVKLKTGIRDHAFDLDRLTALRSDYPDVDVRVDYNQALNPADALLRLREVEAFGPTFIEQPVAGRHRQCMAELAAALDVPLLADESAFGPADLLECIRLRACDAVSIKIMKSGGLRRGLEVAALAEAAGMPAYGGDMFETGIAHLAGTHMIAAAANVTLGCEFYQARWFLDEDLLATPFPIAEGKVAVPDAPGLGIAPEPSRVEAVTLQRETVS